MQISCTDNSNQNQYEINFIQAVLGGTKTAAMDNE